MKSGNFDGFFHFSPILREVQEVNLWGRRPDIESACRAEIHLEGGSRSSKERGLAGEGTRRAYCANGTPCRS